MSDHTCKPILIIEPNDQTLNQLITFLHITVAAVWWGLTIIFPHYLLVTLLVTGILSISAYRYWHQYRTSTRRIKRMVADASVQWELLLSDHSIVKVELLPSSFISSWLCVLIFNDGHHSTYTSVLIAGFSAPQSLIRALVLRIRLV